MTVTCGLLAMCATLAAAPPDPGPDPVEIGESKLYRYEWRASTFSFSRQDEAALAVDPAGRMLAVWSSRRQQSGRYGVYGQWFDDHGVALGEESCLSLWTDSHQRRPAAAFDRHGHAWAVWTSHGQDGDAGAIIARKLGPSPRDAGGSGIRVNQQAAGHATDPVIATGPDGSAMIVWSNASQVRARLVTSTGTAAGEEMPVSPDDVPARKASVAAGADGDFTVVYAAAGPDNRPHALWARRYDGVLRRFVDPVEVTGPGHPIEPVITGVTGGFVVAWLEPAGGDYAVRARRLDSRGCPRGDAFAVAPDVAGSQTGAAAAGAPDGGFAIAFNASDGDGQGIFVRRFAADGSPLGPAARLNRSHQGRQAMRSATGTGRLAVTASGSLVCVWSGDGGFGDGSSVNVTLLSSGPLAEASRGVTPVMRAAEGPLLAAAGPTPHQPPTFDPRDVEQAPREVELGPAGIGFTGILSTGWSPPDPHMAVGPDHLVLMTNGAIAFFTKDGTLTFQDQIEGGSGFWGSLGATGFVFDPETLYDPLSGRFFAMAAEAYAPGDRSYVLVAVSDDSDPNGTWHKYRFETTGLAGDLFDSPNMGVDSLAVYITGDGFGITPNYPIYIFDKASLLAGAPPFVSNSLTLTTTTQSAGIPPVSFNDPPALYMIEHREFSTNNTVRLIALQSPLTGPTLTTTNLSVPAYGGPEDPPQAGTSVRPETFDARFWSVAYRNGSLWATHHINSSRVLARWYEVAMNGWPDSGMQPTLVQSGEIDPGPDIRTFFSSITADTHGNAAMTFARSSPSEFISMSTAFRYASDPLGTFQADVIRQTNSGPYTGSRWGDYSAVDVDPADGLTIWANHEYAVGDSWRTWVAGFTPDFHPADQNFDGIVGIEDFLIVLGNWGPCPGPCPPSCPGDVDDDCEVGILDFLAVLGNWG